MVERYASSEAAPTPPETLRMPSNARTQGHSRIDMVAKHAILAIVAAVSAWQLRDRLQVLETRKLAIRSV
jgi:hypothetical protein